MDIRVHNFFKINPLPPPLLYSRCMAVDSGRPGYQHVNNPDMTGEKREDEKHYLKQF